MTLRTLSRGALDRYLKLVRLPADTALGLLGRNGAAKLAVDRADATARGVAGALLSDEVLTRDAIRRHAAADERATAHRLRGEARGRKHDADREVQAEQDRGDARREEAAKQAAARRKQAAGQGAARKRRAAKTAATRKAANTKAAAATVAAASDRADRARLEQLDSEAEALAERADALTATDEAQRLAEAAAERKAKRKEG